MQWLGCCLHWRTEQLDDRYLLPICPFQYDRYSGWRPSTGSWIRETASLRLKHIHLKEVPFQVLLYNRSILHNYYTIPICSFMLILAYWSAFTINGKICYEWCSAVYLGRKPVPGGVIKVFLGFDNMFPSTSTMPKLINEFTDPDLVCASFDAHYVLSF